MPGSNECALKHCCSIYGSMGEDIHLFRFPKDIERSKEWAAACGQLPFFECKMSCGESLHNSYYRICSLHFEDKMFAGVKKKRLNEDAVPTLHLYKNQLNSKPLNHFAGSCSTQNEDSIFSTSLTMNSNKEFEHIDIKQEVDPLSGNAVIKIEPQDIKSETETQEDDMIPELVDIKQEIQPISYCIASIETPSEMEDTNSLEKLLEGYKNMSQDENKNSEEDESNVSLISESSKTYGGYLDERKYLHVSDNIGESEQNYTFNEYNDMRNISEQIEDRHVNCNICNNSFIYRRNLNTGDTPFICKMCSNRIIQSSLIFAEHSYLQTCDNVRKETFYQMHHNQARTWEDPFKSNSWNESFFQRSSVDKRINREKKFYTCSFCNKSIPRKSDYIKHMRIHTGEKPFECKLCKKSYSQNAHLATHMRTHTGEKPFICDFCSKSFPEKCHLTRHIMNAHTGGKPFICNFCSKSFFDKYELTQHTRTHTGEKPFTCNICNKSFALKSHLLNHMRTHTGEKPFTCNDCKRSFSKKCYYTDHVCNHKLENLF